MVRRRMWRGISSMLVLRNRGIVFVGVGFGILLRGWSPILILLPVLSLRQLTDGSDIDAPTANASTAPNQSMAGSLPPTSALCPRPTARRRKQWESMTSSETTRRALRFLYQRAGRRARVMLLEIRPMSACIGLLVLPVVEG